MCLILIGLLRVGLHFPQTSYEILGVSEELMIAGIGPGIASVLLSSLHVLLGERTEVLQLFLMHSEPGAPLLLIHLSERLPFNWWDVLSIHR